MKTLCCSIITALAALSAIGAENETYPTVGAAITSASEVMGTNGLFKSKLEVASSDVRLVEAFNRAKRQALACVFEGDPVGPWYEAAEPGREAFCMRDTAHQAMGAHALGLARQNLNMLRHFAEAVSESKDWCSYWEVDRYNRPAPVDYANDAEFWFNLPANFDVLDCCYRMWIWSGDPAYIADPIFLNFYDRTVNDYVERWGLGLDQVMKRPRLLNVRGLLDPKKKKFQLARGIPGYNEGDTNYVLGVDVLLKQYDAYVAYSRIQEARKDFETAGKFLKTAAGLKGLLTNTWWNAGENSYFARLNKDYVLEGNEGRYRTGRSRSDNPGALVRSLVDSAQPGRSRWDYPEVPFAWIGDFVNGLMGVNLEAAPSGLSAQQGYWVAAVIRTLPDLGTNADWVELHGLPIRANEVSVRHDGNWKTTLTNQRGPALIWQATFDGDHETLLLNSRPMKAQRTELAGHSVRGNEPARLISWLRVTVSGGGTVAVEIPK